MLPRVFGFQWSGGGGGQHIRPDPLNGLVAVHLGDTDERAIYSPLARDPVFAPIVNQFTAELPDRLAAMRSAFQEKAAGRRRLGYLAHQLKGAAGSYGFHAVTEASRRLEDALLQGRSDQEIAAALEEVAERISHVRPGCPPSPQA